MIGDHGKGDLLERNDVVSNLYRCDALTYRLDDTSTFVSKHNWEGSLGILS